MAKFNVSSEYRNFKEKTFREIKSFDIIDAEGIRDFAMSSQEDMTKTMKEFNLFLNEGVIRFPISTKSDNINLSAGDRLGRFISYIYFKKIDTPKENTETVIMEHYIYDSKEFKFDFITRVIANIDIRILDIKDYLNVEYATLNCSLSSDGKPMSKTEEQRMLETTLEIFYGVFITINYLTGLKETVTKTVPLKRSSKQKNKSNSNIKQRRTIEVLNKDRVLYKIIGSKDTMKTFRTYTRHVDAWSVIGHYRHYKSGKTVWIKPTVRGEGSKIKPKTYKIDKNDNDDGG